MTLPATGLITLGMVNVELGLPANSPISLNQANVRALFGKPSGAISLNDGRGKSSYKIGTLDYIMFQNFGTSGRIWCHVYGCQPYSEISLRLDATTSGNALGTVHIGYADASGDLLYYNDTTNTDGYWYPASQTNWFTALQDGIYSIGSGYGSS